MIFDIIGFVIGVFSIYTLYIIYNFYKIKDKCVVITYYTDFNFMRKLLVLENIDLKKLYELVKLDPKSYIYKHENLYTQEYIYIKNIKVYNNETCTPTIWSKLLLYLE